MQSVAALGAMAAAMAVEGVTAAFCSGTGGSGETVHITPRPLELVKFNLVHVTLEGGSSRCR